VNAAVSLLADRRRDRKILPRIVKDTNGRENEDDIVSFSFLSCFFENRSEKPGKIEATKAIVRGVEPEVRCG
jgi:hypothetical protein